MINGRPDIRIATMGTPLAAMLELQQLNYHPLNNDATTTIASADLQAFIAALGHEAYITDLENL